MTALQRMRADGELVDGFAPALDLFDGAARDADAARALEWIALDLQFAALNERVDEGPRVAQFVGCLGRRQHLFLFLRHVASVANVATARSVAHILSLASISSTMSIAYSHEREEVRRWRLKPTRH
jgi:hypothetical protein